jgi:homoserine kinase
MLDEALALDDPDVLGVFLSGAGPSIAAIARRHSTARVEQIFAALYERGGIPVAIRTLRVHRGTRRLVDAGASAHGRIA